MPCNFNVAATEAMASIYPDRHSIGCQTGRSKQKRNSVISVDRVGAQHSADQVSVKAAMSDRMLRPTLEHDRGYIAVPVSMQYGYSVGNPAEYSSQLNILTSAQNDRLG